MTVKWKIVTFTGAALLIVGFAVFTSMAREAGDRYTSAVEEARSRGIPVSTKELKTVSTSESTLTALDLPPLLMVNELKGFDPLKADTKSLQAAAKATEPFLERINRFIKQAPAGPLGSSHSDSMIISHMVSTLETHARLALQEDKLDECIAYLIKLNELAIALTAYDKPFHATMGLWRSYTIGLAVAERGDTRLIGEIGRVIRSAPDVSFLPEYKRLAAPQQEYIKQVAAGETRETVLVRIGPLRVNRPVKPFEAVAAGGAALEMVFEVVDAWDNPDQFEDIRWRMIRTRRNYSNREAANAKRAGMKLKRDEIESDARKIAAILSIEALSIKSTTGSWPAIEQLAEKGFITLDPVSKEPFEFAFEGDGLFVGATRPRVGFIEVLRFDTPETSSPRYRFRVSSNPRQRRCREPRVRTGRSPFPHCLSQFRAHRSQQGNRSFAPWR